MISDFQELTSKVKSLPRTPRLGVVAAEDYHSVEAALQAAEAGLVTPVLIGNQTSIANIVRELGKKPSDVEIIAVGADQNVAIESVRLAREGKIDALMKGKLETSMLLKAVVNKEEGLGTGRLMTHIALNQIPTYHKLMLTTDGGMVMYPDLDTKRKILENGVEVLHQLGYAEPKVACIAAVEKVNPKMPETIDAQRLKEMNADGTIQDCIVEGPISFDIAFSQAVAETKGFESPVSGDADLWLVPNITVGNVLGKSLVYAAGGSMAGIIYGASVPIVLTSRGASTEEKSQSIALASLIKMEA